MLKDKIIFYGSEDKDVILELVLECLEKTEINAVLLSAILSKVNEDEIIIPKECRCVVMPWDLHLNLSDGVRKLTYCEDGAKGDISVLNIQKRENCTCFEVLYGVFMSRVFIPVESKFTVKQVLMCVCILCGFGASIDKLLPIINEILKK